MPDRTDQGPILGSGLMQSFAIGLFIIGGVVLFGSFRDPQVRPVGLIAFGIGVVAVAFVAYRFWRLRQALGTADLKFDDPVPLTAARLDYSRKQDLAILRQAEAARPATYYQTIAEESDARNICGLSPTFTFLEAAQPTRLWRARGDTARRSPIRERNGVRYPWRNGNSAA